MSHILVGVGGGIAAYKVCAVVRGLTEAGHTVDVVPTAAALRFVGSTTWEALSGRRVHQDMHADVPSVPHVRLGQSADLVVIAPATADLMARAAAGMADDLLTSALLTARCPVLFVPAMHTEMWQHPATVANVATLRARGALVADPASGRLTGADSGPGRMPEAGDILGMVRCVLGGATRRDLVGRHIVVSAGGTREYLDPVRYIGNRSSGKQGYALARAAVLRGARVTLVSGPVSLDPPAGVELVRVDSAIDMHRVVTGAAEGADVVVMAAAVADFRVSEQLTTKRKKTGADDTLRLELVQNPDILADIGRNRRREGQIIVGFAAETGDAHGTVLDYAARKLAHKGADFIVANEVGHDRGFEQDANEAVILGADGSRLAVDQRSKEAVAVAILDVVAGALGV